MEQRYYLLVILALLLLVSCTAPATTAQPQLPEGFLNARIPNVNTLAYVYVHPPTPIVFSTTKGKSKIDARPQALSVWISEDTSVVVNVRSSTPQDKKSLLATARDMKEIWVKDLGEGIVVAPAANNQLSPIQMALTENRWTNFPDKYPYAWETMRRLPSNPPSSVIGVGIAGIDLRLLALLKLQDMPWAKNLTSTLGSLGVGHVIVALYGEAPIVTADNQIDIVLKQQKLGTLILARPTVPNFMVAPVLATAASQENLAKVNLNGQDVFYGSRDQVQGFFRYDGSVLYITLSLSKERAKSLMLSTMS